MWPPQCSHGLAPRKVWNRGFTLSVGSRDRGKIKYGCTNSYFEHLLVAQRITDSGGSARGVRYSGLSCRQQQWVQVRMHEIARA